MTGMTTTAEWVRAGKAVRRRRLELRLTQEVAVAKGKVAGFQISTATWRALEKAARTSYRDSSLIAVCWVLDWCPDGIERLLHDEEPIEGHLPVLSGSRDGFIFNESGDSEVPGTGVGWSAPRADPDAGLGHGGSLGWPAWLEEWLQNELSSIRSEVGRLAALIAGLERSEADPPA